MHILDTSIAYLKGVGPKRAKALARELEIDNYNDLLHYYPFRYVDRTKFHKVSDITNTDAFLQLKGKIFGLDVIGQGAKKRLVALFGDDTGSIQLVWFKGIAWVRQGIQPGKEYVIFGKPNYFNGTFSIPHPEIENLTDFRNSSYGFLQPVYHSTERLKNQFLDTKGIAKLTKALIPKVKNQIYETLPQNIIQKNNLMFKRAAMQNIHFPDSSANLQKARHRLKFEELFYVQFKILLHKHQRDQKVKGFIFDEVGDYFNTFFHKHLPFELTKAQKRVTKEIRQDIRSGKQMNRLLQGDVGSGKTIVALMAMLIALDNGFQACLMAPTEILATQHYNTLQEILGEMNISIGLLTGSVKKSVRKVLHEGLEDGSLQILIGTHALIEPTVQFKNLGLAIIDEQHRFGVAQRASLYKKNNLPPHILVMTATPIPRTLSMTIYGDLEVSVIDELPAGRKAIKTVHRTDASRLRVFGFMKEQIELGRQVYVVYPLIEESEKLDYKFLEDGFEAISRAFPTPKYQVSIVHGRMKADVKEYEMERFVKGQTHILVATTVIEVGVNVPNASVMVIESTERFGLAQLHQLRGRVGRGADQSYCILMSGEKLSQDARTRIQTMCETNDGFKISEVDMKLRGPGDMAGKQQSGDVNFKIADLTTDQTIMDDARESVIEFLKNDPNLQSQDAQMILNNLKLLGSGKMNWSRIS